MQTIVFTGGGTAGHVTPNVALISKLRQTGWNIHYIGSEQGIEKQIIKETGVPFYHISSGKLRRYFDLKNLRDPFHVMKGIMQAYSLLRQIKPQVIFSKGGFVAVPVVIAGKLLGIPVIIHESDMTPGLANRISIPFAAKVCVTFPETLEHIKGKKAILTGLPIREEILQGQADRGRRLCDFQRGKPVLFIMGGSQGSRAINEAVRADLPRLLDRFQVVHLCGKGNLDATFTKRLGYRQFEYASGELPDLLAMADLVVSRAGSTSLNEFLALKKPMVLIPLSLQASRGDQIINAQSFERSGYASVLQEEGLSSDTLYERVAEVYDQREKYISHMSQSQFQDSIRSVISVIEQAAVQND